MYISRKNAGLLAITNQGKKSMIMKVGKYNVYLENGGLFDRNGKEIGGNEVIFWIMEPHDTLENLRKDYFPITSAHIGVPIDNLDYHDKVDE